MTKYFTHEKELTKEELKKLLYNIGLNEEILQKEEMNIIRNKLDKAKIISKKNELNRSI